MLIVTKFKHNDIVYNLFENDEKKKQDAKNRYLGLQRQIKNIFSNSKEYKNKANEFYWELGNIIRQFITENNIREEKYIMDVFESVKSVIYELDENFAKDSLKRKRNLAHYFYMLAGYEKKYVIKTSWSTWHYLFENYHLSSIGQLHEFLRLKLKENKGEFKEGFIRLFCMTANSMFNKCDLTSWDKDNIIMTIELSYSITEKIAKNYNIYDRKIRKPLSDKLKLILKDNYTNLLYCYAGDISFKEFEEKILLELNN